jgi:hypothetical protein
MKTNSRTLLLLVSILAVSSAQLKVSAAETAPRPCVWIVGPGGHFRGIQEAIDSERVRSGDTLKLQPTRFAENVVVPPDKLLTIMARYPSRPPAIVGPPVGPVVAASDRQPPASRVTLQGAHKFSNVVVLGGGQQANGIFLTGPAIVTGCEVSDCKVGVVGGCASNFFNDNPAIVEFCDIHDNIHGIKTGEMEVVYSNNVIHHNESDGIHNAGGSTAKIVGNLIVSNGGHGINMCSYHEIGWASHPEIANNTIAHNGLCGIYMFYCNPGDMPVSPFIRDNVVIYNRGFGIDANTFYGQPCGVLLTGGCYPHLRHNNFWGNNPLHGGAPDDPLRNLGNQAGNWRVPWPKRQVKYMSFDPEYIPETWYYEPYSRSIDTGSVFLHPGETQPDRPDAGWIDLGYHLPARDEPAAVEAADSGLPR